MSHKAWLMMHINDAYAVRQARPKEPGYTHKYHIHPCCCISCSTRNTTSPGFLFCYWRKNRTHDPAMLLVLLVTPLCSLQAPSSPNNT